MIYQRAVLSFKIKLNDEFWTLYFYRHKEFLKLCRQTVCLAYTFYNHPSNIREIHFDILNLSKTTIAHELLHACLSHGKFFGYKKNKVDEEDVCDEVGKNYKVISLLVDAIYDEVRKKR